MAARCSVAVGPRAASGSCPPCRTSGTEAAVARFPRAARLRATRDYRRVQEGGGRVRQAHLLVLYLPGGASQSRFGLTVSRKVGNAVTRNRVKRWLREAIREEREQVSGCWDVVFIAHPSAAEGDAARLRAQVAHALQRISAGRPSERSAGARRR